MDYNEPFILFDMPEIYRLQDLYQSNVNMILAELPRVKWNSRAKTVLFFKENFDLELDNVRIDYLSGMVESLEHDSPAFDTLNGFVLYLKLKYSLKNYIDCIIRHNQDGRVRLRHFQGQWVLPNRQPTSLNPEITACVLTQGKGDSLWEQLQVTSIQ